MIINGTNQYYIKQTGEEVKFDNVYQDFQKITYTLLTKKGTQITLEFPRYMDLIQSYVTIKLEEENINQDIIKLIESGYKFKTFWGTALDGKEFHIEM
jgi:hypothetical protein